MRHSIRHALRGVAVVAITGGCIVPSAAHAVSRHFSVAAQPARSGIVLFAQQAGIQILVSTDDTQGVLIGDVRGDFTVEQGLRNLIAPAHLRVVSFDGRTAVLAKTAPALRPAALRRVVALAQPAEAAPAPQRAAPAPAAEPVAAAPVQTDIIVTAQKRAQNVQNVPLAVQVVGTAQLQASGVRNFADLSKIAPSLVVRPAEQPVNASISIRGIGTFAYSIGVEPSVAVQVDDVPIAFQARAFTNLSDLERIEVLRGPQSTLYGKSASAGLINIVTQAPTAEFSGNAGMVATNDSEFQYTMGVSGPITDTLRFRVTGNWVKFLGNVRNVTDGSWLNGREDVSIRGKLRWQPIEPLTLDASLDYTNGETSVGLPFVALSPAARLRGNAAYGPAAFLPGVTASPTNTSVADNYLGGTDYCDFQQALRIAYDFGFATLTSISSHDKYLLHDRLDQDNTPVAAYDNRQTGTFNTSQWTQELRLVSASEQPFRYTIGLFYADVDYGQLRDRGQVFSLSHYTATAESLQKAVFAQLEYDILPSLTATGGVRYGGDKASYSFLDRQNGNAFFKGSDSRDYVTYRGNLQYKFTPDVNVFVTYATGRKGQTYDLTTGFDANRAAAGAIAPETSKDWEAGLRSRFFDRRLTLNVTAFTTDYRNFQAQGIDTLPDGTSNFRLTNVGRLRTRGIEVEAVGRLGSALTVRASGAYVDARIREFSSAPCYPLQTVAVGCVGTPARQNLTGARPPQAPVWKGTADAEYARDLGDLPFQGVLGTAVSYQSSSNFSLTQDPFTIQRAYAVLNLTAGIRARDRRWQVMGFVNNVTDRHYYANLQNSSGNFGNSLGINALLPRDFSRYFGIRANYDF